MKRLRNIRLFAVCLFACTSAGCSLWPFQRPVQTSYVTPAKRIAAIKALGERASQADIEQQRTDADELARLVQTESDPLVREAIVRSIARLQAPMAQQVLVAGLNDEDPYVREACCRLLGRRRDATAVAPLGEVVRSDGTLEVRVAATKALGALGSTESIPAISIALNDRDPALQFVGVQAMRQASGQNLGNDVATWRAFAARSAPANPDAPALAEKAGTKSNY